MHQSILFWGNREFIKTVPINQDSTNVATFRLATGYNKFHAYCCEAGIGKEYDADPLCNDEIMIEDAQVVSDDKESVQSISDDSDEVSEPTHQHNDMPRKFDLNATKGD